MDGEDRKNIQIIRLLSKVSQKNRKKIICGLKKNHIDCISRIFSKLLTKRLPLDLKLLKKLKPHQFIIKRIAQSRTPLRIKKKLLQSQKGGSLLGIILPLAISALSGLLSQ